MRLARVIGAIGRVLVGVGSLLLLFVGYQLGGTGIQASRSQDALRGQLRGILAPTTATTATTAGDHPSGSTTTTEPPIAPPTGHALAIIRIPKIGVDRAVVEGVGVADLKKGPGHYPGTPAPGQPGNAAIAGHRTTYGAPFYRLDELGKGDEIVVRTAQGEFHYVVDRTSEVQPDRTEVLNPTTEARLTLTTCTPRFSARRRLVVSAVLKDEPVAAPTTTTTTRPSGAVKPSQPEPPALDQAGLSGDPTARWPTLWWGLFVAVIGLLTYLAARRWRPFWAYLAGTPVFLVVLFVFFENVSRLLPANI